MDIPGNVNELFRRFWEMQKASSWTMKTREDGKGRYFVQIPFKLDTPILGNTDSLALRQFHHLEKKQSTKKKLKNTWS